MEAEAPATTALVVRPREAFQLVPQSLSEAMEFAKLIASSGLCPKQFQGKPADVLLAVQLGAEVGVTPIQALQNIAVVNGRPCMWGDLVVALVQASGHLEYLRESWDGKTATATIKRRGMPERTERFGLEDAARAGLAGKDTYKQWPQRMCGWRAKTFAIRAEFSDVLKGLTLREEADDLPPEPSVPDIVMPSRASAAPPDVDAFLRGAGSAPPRNGGTQAAPAGDEWRGVITNITEKSGTSKGRAWMLYSLHGEDGSEFGTFDTGVKDAAAFSLGDPVLIRFTKTERGNLNAVSIEAIPAAGAAE